MRFMWVSAFPGSLERQEDLEVRQQRGDADPRDGQRNEHLPAQAHDLVVAVARERSAEPDETAGEEEHLGQQPRRTARGWPRPRRRRSTPPTAAAAATWTARTGRRCQPAPSRCRSGAG